MSIGQLGIGLVGIGVSGVLGPYDTGTPPYVAGNVCTSTAVLYSSSERVHSSLAINCTLSEYTSVSRGLMIRYSLQPDAQVIQGVTTSTAVKVQGSKPLDVKTITLGHSTSSYSWAGTLELLTQESFNSLAHNDEVLITLGGTSYLVIVDSSSRSTSINAPTLSVPIISPTAKLTTPRSALITRAWDSPTMARTICEQAVGQVIDWGIIDWLIAGGLVSAAKESPLSILARVLGAVKAVISTNANGTLKVRYNMKYPPQEWSQHTPDHSYSDVTDAIVVHEVKAVKPYFNNFFISSLSSSPTVGEPSYTMSLALDDRPDGLNKGVTAFKAGDIAYVYMVVPKGLTVSKVEVSAGSIRKLYAGMLNKEETLTFGNSNTGTLSMPAHSYFSSIWQGKSLGQVHLSPDGLNVTTDLTGTAMAKVKYRTNVIFYAIQLPANINGSKQFNVSVYAEASSAVVGSGSVLPIDSIVAIRGEGNLQGADVQEPLLSYSLEALKERGRAELNEYEDTKIVTMNVLFKDNVHDGDLIKYTSTLTGEEWCGIIDSVSHKASLGKVETTLEVIRV